MLRHPALPLSENGADTKGKAFFTQKHIAAVGGVDAPNGIFLRELGDIFLFRVNLRLGMQAFYEVRALVQLLDYRVADAGHDVHGKYHIDGIGDLDADFGEFAAHNPHGIGDYVHRAPLHRPVKELAHLCVHFVLLHPVVGRTCVLFLRGADDRPLFVSCHVFRICAVIVTARELFLVKLNHFAGFHRQRPDRLQLLFAAVNPEDFRRLCHGGAFRHPVCYFFVLNLNHFVSSLLSFTMFGYLTLASKASFIMLVKEVCLSSTVLFAPVTKLSLMDMMERALTSLYAAFM